MDFELIKHKYWPIVREFVMAHWIAFASVCGAVLLGTVVVLSWPTSKRESKVPQAPTQTFSLSATPFFGEGGALPSRFCRDGSNFSPPLEIVKPPADVKQFALVFEPVQEAGEKAGGETGGEAGMSDAPAEPAALWILYNVPPTTTNLPEGIPVAARLSTPPDAMQGTNGFGSDGYIGPFSDGRGGRRFVFRLYALSEVLPKKTKAGLTRSELMELIKDHVIATTELECVVR